MWVGSRSGYPKNPRKYQGGWIQLAIAAAAALSGMGAKKKADRRQASLDERTFGLENQQLALAKKQDDRAQDLFDEYKSTYQPRERQLVNTAFGDELSPARAEARATTDVRDAFGTMRDTTERNQRRLGVNPESGAALALDRELGLNEARVEAGSRTRAREDTRDRNFARQLDAVSLGRGLPGSAASMTALAQQGTGAVASLANLRSRDAASTAYEAGANFGHSLTDLASEAYDLYQGRAKPPPVAGQQIVDPFKRDSQVVFG